MDLVWICRKGPNEELRYSLRSALTNLQFDNFWVIGQRPHWYKGPFIYVYQRAGKKYENAKANLQKLISSSQVADDFILMNDDFYVLKPTEVKPYYSGTLEQRIQRNSGLSPNAKYLQRIIDTKEMLEAQGIEKPLDYSLHIPMQMHKEGLAKSLDYPLIRSGYGNLNNVGGEQRRDVKIYAGKIYEGLSYEITPNSDFVSSHDDSFPDLRDNVLAELFPDPMPHES
jgi:hypothetical protein